MEAQRQCNWCWAAVAIAVHRSYPNPTAVTQCQVASRIREVDTCYANGQNRDCNRRELLSGVLSELGNAGRHDDFRPEFNEIQEQIDDLRPVCLTLEWPGASHFVTIFDYSFVNGHPRVHVGDPLPGLRPRDL